MFNWDDLRFFLALLRAGHVSGAAKILGVSRSTVNRRIAALEEVAGVRLVERQADSLVLTAAGEHLAPIAERIESDALAASRLFTGHDFRLAGRVDISGFEGASSVLAPVIAELHQRYPLIEIRLLTSAHKASLRRRESDIAIRAIKAPGRDLFGRKLGVLSFAVYGRADVVAQEAPAWVIWDERMPGADTWNLVRWEESRAIAARVDSILAMVELVLAGAGVALLPVPFAEGFASLVPLGPVPHPDTQVDVWVLTHSDLQRSARVRAVMSHIGERVPALLRGSKG